jgi:D-inositol-3-phosphate glycosyltransferase
MFHTLGAVKNAVGIGEGEPGLRIQTERELVNGCHRIIGSTRKEKEDLIRYYGASPAKIHIIPCGVNLDLFRPIDKGFARCRLGLNGGSIILFVGRMIPLKGIDRLLMAIACLKGMERPKLVVVGGDEQCRVELERLRSLSQRLMISDSVDFLGFVDHEKLPFFYNAADLCVVPSYYESFGLVALESLACGTPVVATKVGGIQSVIQQGETGYVVSDNAPHRLADKIGLLLSAPKATGETTDFIRASVARFSWSNIAEVIIGEYRAVLRDHLTASRTTDCLCGA